VKSYLTIHKLIAVVAFVLLAAMLYRTNQAGQLGTTEIIAGAVTGLLFLGTIVTGGLLSIGKPLPAAVLTLHQITPFLTVLSTTWLVWQVLPEQIPLLR
jgi:heme A synthase